MEKLRSTPLEIVVMIYKNSIILVGLAVLLCTCKSSPSSSENDQEYNLQQVTKFEVHSDNILLKGESNLFVIENYITELNLSDLNNPSIVGESETQCRYSYSVNTSNYIYTSCISDRDSVLLIDNRNPYLIAGGFSLPNSRAVIRSVTKNEEKTRLFYFSSELGSNGFVTSVDITQPSNPKIAREYSFPEGIDFCYTLTFYENKLYASCGSDGIFMLNLLSDDSFEPFISTEINQDLGSWESVDIAIKNNIVFVAGRDEGVQIFNINDPSQSIGELRAIRDSVETLTVIDDKLFVSDGSILSVFSIENPEEPISLTDENLPGIGNKALKFGDYIIVSTNNYSEKYVVVFEEIEQ